MFKKGSDRNDNYYIITQWLSFLRVNQKCFWSFDKLPINHEIVFVIQQFFIISF